MNFGVKVKESEAGNGYRLYFAVEKGFKGQKR
jgi:hypothetical protein